MLFKFGRINMAEFYWREIEIHNQDVQIQLFLLDSNIIIQHIAEMFYQVVMGEFLFTLRFGM